MEVSLLQRADQAEAGCLFGAELTRVDTTSLDTRLMNAGDPRMSIPGAENPRKIHNIVDAQMDKFKGVYGRLLQELDGLAVVGVPGGSLHARISSLI
jgi:hypothetical protein